VSRALWVGAAKKTMKRRPEVSSWRCVTHPVATRVVHGVCACAPGSRVCLGVMQGRKPLGSERAEHVSWAWLCACALAIVTARVCMGLLCACLRWRGLTCWDLCSTGVFLHTCKTVQRDVHACFPGPRCKTKEKNRKKRKPWVGRLQAAGSCWLGFALYKIGSACLKVREPIISTEHLGNMQRITRLFTCRNFGLVSKWAGCAKYTIHHLQFSSIDPHWAYVAGLDYECVCGRWDGGGMSCSGNMNSSTGEEAGKETLSLHLICASK